MPYISNYLCVRPGVREFLLKLSEFYEIIIWTASYEDYTNPILDYLGVKANVKKVLYRGNCTIEKNAVYKDLNALNRNLEKTIIVDNTAACFAKHPRNGILIADFIGKPD